jgi:outer membrane protein TolC
LLISNCLYADAAPLPITAEAGAPVTNTAVAATAVPVTVSAMPAASPVTANAVPAETTTTANIVDFAAAVTKCVENNAGIRQALAEYEEAKANAEKIKGRYDLNFKGGISYSESKVTALTVEMLEETKLLAYTAGLDNRLITGGDLSLNFTSARTSLLYPAYNWGIDPLPFRMGAGPYYYPEIALSYSQPVLKDFWGDPQGKTIKAAEYRAKSAQEKLRGEVIGQVCGLKEASILIYAQESILKAKKDGLKSAENLYIKMKSAGAPETDLLLVKAAMLSAKAEPAGMENRLKTARENFLNMAGYAPDEWETAAVNVEETVEDSYIPQEMTQDLEDTLVDMQPQVTAAKLLADSAAMEKDAAENSLLPELDLTGSYGLTGLSGGLDTAFTGLASDKFRDFTAGVVFSWSFPGREGAGGFKAKEEGMKKAGVEYESLKKQAKIAVRSAFNGLKAAKDDYEMKRQAGQLLSRRLLLQRSAGAVVRELMMSQDDYFNAKAAEAGAFAAYAKSVMEWNRINGKYDSYYNDYIKSMQK